MMIPPSLLMIYKRMMKRLAIPRLSRIFAPQPRGSGLRRGTTRERLVVDMGQYFIAYRFILRQAACEKYRLADFFYAQHRPIMINRNPISVKFS